jgi:aspartyl-tRNA(Asn)/glutamyl-tRNA(Gln) amidotransferase subunit A
VTALDSIWLARPETPPTGPRAVAVKDLLDTAGLVTTYGSIIFAEHRPAKNAAAVNQLLEAGFTIAGKTNLHEFAYGVSSQNEHFGTVPNPRFPGRLAGGSSGGSAAAIAAGDVELALGTDSGGSIRIPAAWCGIVGFKPTFDLVDATGCFPLAPSYDHVGPMASSVAGCIELMRALVPGFEVAVLDSLADLRIGSTWLGEADEPIRARIAETVAALPGSRNVELPLPDPAENRLFMREVADVHRGLFPERADEYGEGVRTKVERCFAVTDAEVATAQRLRAEYSERCSELFEGVDLLVAPAVAIEPPPNDVNELELRGRVIRLTYPIDALGWPALAIPAGLTENGLPASIQLLGKPGADSLVLAAGAVLASLI